jgi:hypothetical protein
MVEWINAPLSDEERKKISEQNRRARSDRYFAQRMKEHLASQSHHEGDEPSDVQEANRAAHAAWLKMTDAERREHNQKLSPDA